MHICNFYLTHFVLTVTLIVFLFFSFGGHRNLHSFPTRRSSDLSVLLMLLNRPARRVPRSDSASSMKRKASAPSLMRRKDRKSTRLNSSHVRISYAVFCLKKKNQRSTCPAHPDIPDEPSQSRHDH